MVVIFIEGGLTHLWGVGGGYEASCTGQTEDCDGMGGSVGEWITPTGDESGGIL